MAGAGCNATSLALSGHAGSLEYSRIRSRKIEDRHRSRCSLILSYVCPHEKIQGNRLLGVLRVV